MLSRARFGRWQLRRKRQWTRPWRVDGSRARSPSSPVLRTTPPSAGPLPRGWRARAPRWSSTAAPTSPCAPPSATCAPPVSTSLRAGLADGGGAVVNVSSGTVNKTTPSMIAYAAAKAALNAVTRTLARDLGPLGVRVNAVAPGLTKTSATRAMWEADDGAAAGSNLVLGHLTTADDIANACVFLLSDEAASITGVVVDVDGGNHLQSGGWAPMA